MSWINNHRLWGGMLLVSGTAIGAGMLALPLTTGVGGFYYAVPTICLIFAYMLCCLFVLLEANLYSSDPSANIISMAKQFLGPFWEGLSWFSFLLVLYAASAAYIDGGGSLLSAYTHQSLHLSHNQGCMAFAVFFGALGYFGIRYIDFFNRFLMIGLLVSYVLLIVTVSPHVHAENLQGGQPNLLWAAIPVLVLSFTSHIILPSLRNYLNDHIPSLKKALIVGSIVPLVFYLVWEYLLVGILPQQGPGSLMAIAQSPHPLATLSATLQQQHIFAIVSTNAAFSFFAMVTSYLGVIISLGDFLADGLNIKRDARGKLILMVASFVPPILFALMYPSGFIAALSYGGVFIAVLYGLVPVLIVWKARYHLKCPNPGYRVAFGKLGLIMIAVCATMIMVLQIMATQHALPHLSKHTTPATHHAASTPQH